MTQSATQPGRLSKATIFRVLAQCWLAWPAVALLPFLLIQVQHSFAGNLSLPKLAFLALPWCCLALVATVFSPRAWYRKPLLGWLFLILLTFGIACAAVIFCIAFRREAPTRLMEYRLFFGPVIVALWNIVRIVRVRWFAPALLLFCAGIAPAQEAQREELKSCAALKRQKETPWKSSPNPEPVSIADDPIPSNASFIHARHLNPSPISHRP